MVVTADAKWRIGDRGVVDGDSAGPQAVSRSGAAIVESSLAASGS
jgi:hypothetical protein